MFLSALVMLCLSAFGAEAFLDDSDPSNKIQFNSSESMIDESTPLKFECTFLPWDHPEFDILLSLKLLKRPFNGGKFNPLVSVNQKGLDDHDDFNGAVAGHIAEGNRSSVLTVEFNRPTLADGGEYTCRATGLTLEHDVVGSESSLLIGHTEVDSDQIVECFTGGPMAPSLTTAKDFLLKCGAHELNWFQLLREATTRRLASDGDVWGVSDISQASSFYIFTKAIYLNFEIGERMCTENNGYFVEINTEEEFHFLELSLKKLHEAWGDKRMPFSFLMTGAKMANIGDEFRFVTHPDDSVYLGHWEDGEPDMNHIERNWLALRVMEDDTFEMLDGVKESSLLGYICKVAHQ